MTVKSSSKLGTITFTGKSGTEYEYEFGVYPLNTRFKEGYEAVYFVTRRYKTTDGKFSHKRIYVGETDDLSERFDNHHKESCFGKHGANCVCIHKESRQSARLRIEDDLISKHNPPCND